MYVNSPSVVLPTVTHHKGMVVKLDPCPGEQAPSVQLVLPDLAGNRKEFDVPPNDFNVKNSTDSSFCRGAVIPDVSRRSTIRCKLGQFDVAWFFPPVSDTNTMIIGNIFLKNAYTQFDYTPGKERVGFAYLK